MTIRPIPATAPMTLPATLPAVAVDEDFDPEPAASSLEVDVAGDTPVVVLLAPPDPQPDPSPPSSVPVEVALPVV
jgi:hypothetical protein